VLGNKHINGLAPFFLLFFGVQKLAQLSATDQNTEIVRLPSVADTKRSSNAKIVSSSLVEATGTAERVPVRS
jgi:hypothetical protein